MALLSLFAKLGLDKTGFDASLNAATKKGEKFGADLKSAIAGVFTVQALTTWLHSVSEAVGRIKDLSEQSGITTDEVQKTDAALKQSGLSFEDLGASLNRLAGSRRDAVEGNKELRDTFEKYGVTLKDLNNPSLRTYDVLLQISKALSGVNLTARDQIELMDLLGAKSGKLVNVLAGLADIEPVSIFEEEQILQIDEATKAMERFNREVLIGSAAGASRMLDLIDNLSGVFDAQAAAAATPPTVEEIATANARKHRRVAREDALQKAGLFEVDKDKKKSEPLGLFDILKQTLELSSRYGGEIHKGGPGRIDSDQFQRIGAFTSGGPQATQVSLLRNMQTELREIKTALTGRGIVVRGSD